MTIEKASARLKAFVKGSGSNPSPLDELTDVLGYLSSVADTYGDLFQHTKNRAQLEVLRDAHFISGPLYEGDNNTPLIDIIEGLSEAGERFADIVSGMTPPLPGDSFPMNKIQQESVRDFAEFIDFAARLLGIISTNKIFGEEEADSAQSALERLNTLKPAMLILAGHEPSEAVRTAEHMRLGARQGLEPAPKRPYLDLIDMKSFERELTMEYKILCRDMRNRQAKVGESRFAQRNFDDKGGGIRGGRFR